MKTSYRAFARLAANPHTGVFLRPAVFHFRHAVADNPVELAKMHELQAHVPGFVHDPALIRHHGVNPDAQVTDAYSYLAPMVDTDRYLAWLQREALAAGCRLISRRISGTLREQEHRLRDELGADAIVNCTGLGSIELAADPALDPPPGSPDPRGQRQHHHAPHHHRPRRGPRRHQRHPGHDLHRAPGRGPAPPRRTRRTRRRDTDIDLNNHQPLRDALARCQQFLPALAGAAIDQADPVRAGLRPFRTHNVRLETEPGTRIIHNYGHGGAGVTLSWGRAEDAAQLTEHLLADRHPAAA
ncbi:FAD-dependent oxidoreductase [Streptomyces sp. UG1]|uniref:FAD-dependent oxidoreductase n=1 Tax=Streptomyces sp. UG1 TaxID=3417652 RepID=UPI003CF76317